MQASETRDWNLLERVGMPQCEANNTLDLREGATDVSQTVNPESVGETQVVQEHNVPPQGESQSFPVYKAVPNTGHADRYDVIAWRVVQDLRDKVAEYGLGSVQVMQFLRVLNTDLLAPFDTRHIAQALFQPVQFRVFLDNQRQAYERVATENRHLPQGDPRLYVVDILREEAFSNPDFQATWDCHS